MNFMKLALESVNNHGKKVEFRACLSVFDICTKNFVAVYRNDPSGYKTFVLPLKYTEL